MENNNAVLLNEWQIERLCILVYMDGILCENPETKLKDIVEDFKKNSFSETPPCLMSAQEWKGVFESVLKDDALCSLSVRRFEDITEDRIDVRSGHRAVCFMDEHENAYIIFRGTHGDSEWIDNAETMIMAETVQQKASLNFAVNVKENLAPKTITVAGHSKGGNKAQFCHVVASEGYIDRCISVDGPGFSKEFIAKYKDRIEKLENLYLIAEQRDYVNALGLTISQTQYYRGFRSESKAYGNYGYPLAYFHSPNSLRLADEAIAVPSQNSPISSFINDYTSYFLITPAYKKEREGTIRHIISLLLKKSDTSNSELAHAIARLSVLFFDMTAGVESFWQRIMDILTKEPNVLVATIEDFFAPSELMYNEKSLKQCVIEELVCCILESWQNTKNFFVSIKIILGILKKISVLMAKDAAILLYVARAIASISKYMGGKSKSQLINDFCAEANSICEILSLDSNNLMDNKDSHLMLSNAVDMSLERLEAILCDLESIHNGADLSLNSINPFNTDNDAANINIDWRKSQNYMQGRAGYIPDTIVCHITEGSFAGAISWLCDTKSGVSAHFVVSKIGQIVQLVRLEDTAYANGTTTKPDDSRYYGLSYLKQVRDRKTNANYYTISIEHEGFSRDTGGKLTPQQQDATVQLIKHIRSEVKRIYKIDIKVDAEHITGHRAVTPKWKYSCPGEFFPYSEIIERVGKGNGERAEGEC